MPLVEAVARKRRDLFPKGGRLPLVELGPRRRRTAAAGHKGRFDRRHLARTHFAHAAAQMIRLRPAQAGYLPRHAQNLLLKEQHPLG